MPTNDPSSAPPADAAHPTEEMTAASVLRDDSAGQPDEIRSGPGAASPNSPIDASTPHDGGRAEAENEARVLSASSAPAEPGHDSR